MQPASPISCLDSWLSRVLRPEAATWLRERCQRVADGAERDFFAAFSAASRHAGKAALALTRDELATATSIRPGWDPSRWTCDQAARARLVLALPAPDAAALVAVLDRAAACADLGETVVLYQTLPLLAHPSAHRARCAEGVRNNMKPVFEAVALDNPYASEQLDDNAWNQLVVKCLFVDSPLHRVVGLDRRANPALTRMLCGLAHERWAAKRQVSPELWRPVGRCFDEQAAPDFERVLSTGSADEQLAAVLALSASDHPRARTLAASRPQLLAQVGSGAVGWSRFHAGG